MTDKEKPAGMVARYKTLAGRTHRIETGCSSSSKDGESDGYGRMYVTFNRNWEDGRIIEMFTKIGKTGGCLTALLEGLCRCATRGLRYGVPPERVRKDLRGILCEKPVGLGENKTTSCCDAIGKALDAELQWEKTEDFKQWWKECRERASLKEEIEGTELSVHGAGGGEHQEVCDGRAGGVQEEIVLDAGTPVEEEQGEG